MKRATCIHLLRGDEVLFAMQQKKIIGLKGYGGVINDGEDPLESAVRELWEETGGDPDRRIYRDEVGGITVYSHDLRKMAVIDFYNGTEAEVPFGDPSFRVLFLEADIFTGSAISTKEMMDPDWYSRVKDRLPIANMVQGDDLFIPRILAGERLTGWLRRTKDFKEILGSSLTPCEEKDLII